MSCNKKFVLLPVKNDNLYVNELGFSYGDERKRAKSQVRNTFILHFVKKGTVVLEGEEISEGEAFLLTRGVPYAFRFEADFEHYWIGFGGMGAEKLLSAFGVYLNKHIRLKLRNSEWLFDYISHSFESIEKSKDENEALLLLMNCLPHIEKYKNYASIKYAEQAKIFIENNYRYELTMESVAKSVNVSEKHLCKLFKKAYGISPQQHLITTRMEAAKKLLLDTDLMIKEISNNVGFSSQFAFSSAYRHYFGYSPSKQRLKGVVEIKKVSLPPIRQDKELELKHFPNNLYAAVFRLWETVEAKKIAYALDLPLERVFEIADEMGLPEQKHNVKWETRGYITTIKNCWHILSYEQILKVLGWTEEHLAVVLKEEDFLAHKLGDFKPYCKPVTDVSLNESQKKQVENIRNIMQSEFSELFTGEKSFEFFEKTETKAITIEKSDGLRMIFSFCGLYASVLDTDIEESYPEEMLKKYSQMGINAVWLHTTLYQITEFPFDKRYSAGFEKRQERLRQLVNLADKYGIKVYLYLNEPRCMPMGFFEKFPELLGRHNELYGALCTSDSRVLDYVENAVESLCKAVPGLGGFFTITMSENLTHCKSIPDGDECEKCKDTPEWELISGVLNAISRGCKKADESIKLIAWTWAWVGRIPDEDIEKCIKSLPKDIIIQSNSETRKPFVIGGVEGVVGDYSMSIPGPGEVARKIWKTARENGHEIAAKVQVNDTWECSTVPYLPVFDLIREHMKGLKTEGIEHLMLSWTLGGYPSINLKVASECLEDTSEEKYVELLKNEYGEYADMVKKAATQFSIAFKEFPFHINNIYNGPQNPGPSNLLFEKSTGFEASMTGFALDELDRWRGPYPRDIYLNQLKLLSEKWAEGLKIIEDMPDCEFKQFAWTGYMLFNSSYLQTSFIMERDEGRNERMPEILSKEREMALLMYKLMSKNSKIGFEAANHYYFNKGMLAEKVICCDYLKNKLS